MPGLQERPLLRPRGARLRGFTLRTKIVSLVALAALAPAALVGFAAYVTAQKIQADQLATWLGQQAAAAERETVLVFENRLVDAKAFARSRSLWESLEHLEHARDDQDPEGRILARNRIDGYLQNIQEHDPSYEGLLLLDAGGEVVASTAPTKVWDPTAADVTSQGIMMGPGSSSYLQLTREIRGPSREVVGRLVAVSALKDLWLRLASSHFQSEARLRVLDPRSRTLFDSSSYPETPQTGLSSAAAKPVFTVRIGNATYEDEAGVEVVAAHRLEPSFHFAVLVEVPKAEAMATSRRFRDFALRGSLMTVALIATLGCVLAFHLTGPLRKLQRGVERATDGDVSQRLEVNSTDEVGYLTVAVNQMFDALEKSKDQLERMSSTDELTGLYNRRHLARMFDVELNRAGRASRPLSVLMIDLDHFKAFNEHFGHLQGDNFLRHVASFLKTWLRATDVLARYGGEEFTALLPDTDLETAIEIAERLRTRFEDARAPAIGGGEPVTMSIGVASWSGDSALKENLIEAADKALYEAKRNGRNRVRVAA